MSETNLEFQLREQTERTAMWKKWHEELGKENEELKGELGRVYELVDHWFSEARKFESDVKFLLSFAPQDCPEGLDGTFYRTLTYKGDKALQDRIDGIREAIKDEAD